MKVPYSWLKELVDIQATPEQVAADLATTGIEVASIEYRKVPDGIIVAEILSVDKHPNADRLSVCRVNTGKDQPETIVCGAPNVKPGMKAPLAVPGCVLGPEMEVKKAKIRGMESSGMLCSERELGLSDDHSGLMNLPDDSRPGTPLSSIFPNEIILETEITANKGDCLSILGIAREVGAKYGLPVKKFSLLPEESGDDINRHISVIIENPDACPRYIGRLVRDITIGDSPEWLKYRLRSCGLRPINNVVDITNYIMLLFGQPMHAFDYSRIDGKKIIVKNATDGQSFVTLDDMEHKLCSGDLLICDSARAVALAGIMGGANSQITADTREVFLECAYFYPPVIRKTAKRLGLSSDSSYRFERGVDPADGLSGAIDTAAELLRLYAGGKIVSGTIDACPRPLMPRRINLRMARISRLLGVDIPKEKVISMLSSLNVRLTSDKGDTMEFEAPLFRHDLDIEADLIEEIGRLYGYDNIPSAEKAFVKLTNQVNPAGARTVTIRKALAFSGLHEIVTCSMTASRLNSTLNPEIQPVRLRNPLNPEMAEMRTTLVGSMLQVTEHNRNHKNANCRLFEIGRIYHSIGTSSLPDERDIAGLLIENRWEDGFWQNPSGRPVDFNIIKALVENCLKYCGSKNINWNVAEKNVAFLGDESAFFKSDIGISGFCGRVNKEICSMFDIDSAVYFAHLDITSYLNGRIPTVAYSPSPRFPAVERDFAFVMPAGMHASVISDEITSASELVEAVEPFDVYQGEKLGEKMKSIAFAMRLRAKDRTLTDKEADEICRKITVTMEKKHGVTLRT